MTEAVSAARGPRVAARLGTATLLVALLLALAGPASAKPAPDTLIDSGPATSTSSTSASFTFHATQAGATFACTLDAGAPVACTSPKAYGGLVAGTHTFSVAATANGSTDSSPATFTWTIDTTAPTAPTNLTASTPTTTSVALTWTAGTDNRGVTGNDVYRDGSKLVGVGAVTSYTDATVTAGSTHTYAVLARDAAGNSSAPEHQRFGHDTDVGGGAGHRHRHRPGSLAGNDEEHQRLVHLPRDAVRGHLQLPPGRWSGDVLHEPGDLQRSRRGDAHVHRCRHGRRPAGPHARLGELGGRPDRTRRAGQPGRGGDRGLGRPHLVREHGQRRRSPATTSTAAARCSAPSAR